MQIAEAEIHHFFTAPNGTDTLDEDGEPMLGFYYRLPGGDLMGPYGCGAEATQAAEAEWAQT